MLFIPIPFLPSPLHAFIVPLQPCYDVKNV
jgi:hypothetical protein